jgi:malonyl-CoA/methylmalonyl-CoA synthetase
VTDPNWARHLSPATPLGAVDLTGRRSLPAAWVAHWREAPDRAVVRDPEGRWFTGQDLLDRSAAVAGRLTGAGLVAGDRILMSGVASIELVVAHVAALRAGLVVVPLNPTYTRREVEVIVGDAHPRAAVLESEEMQQWVREATDSTDAPPVVTGVDVDLAEAAVPALDRAAPDSAALLAYTSGTTGAPKGVVLSHANLLASAEALRLAWRWDPEDRLILCLPLFHVHGLGVGLHGTLLAGASVILQARFDPAAVLAAAEDATLFFGVPTMYSRLVEAEGADRLARLRLCVSGSAPLSADLHRRIADRCGQVVLERYGMTETVMLVSNPYDGERRAGTVGLPLPGVELRLEPGTDEIAVRGPNVFAGYLDRPDANATAFTPDGWFLTGDIGRIDDDGYVQIVGRAKDLIITGGYNVYPREIEDVLRTHPAVTDVAVVGVPSDEWGETVAAYVEAGPDFDAAALVEWASARLAPYKRPRSTYRVDALPRNSLGKVQRHELHPPA